ncbi:MAG: MFS transporter [Kiritimatiellae bacterium]|nr:MFS transporter [Kiritimatiellia bacterium]
MQPQDDPRRDPLIARTTRISTAEGVLAQVHFTVAAPGSVFLTKFAVLLGAGPLQFGVLAAIGQFALLFQPLGALLTRRRRSRKGTVVGWALLSRLLVAGFGVTALLLSPRDALLLFLALLLGSAVIQAVSANVWVAWISDLIPREIRGRFFARRSQWLLLAGTATGMLLGLLLDGVQADGPWPFLARPGWAHPEHLPAVFAVLFAGASLLGALGQVLLWRQPERPKDVEMDSAATLLLAPFGDPNFRRLLLFAVWWMLAIGVGAPFWQPFMIANLAMPLLQIQIYATISTVASLISLHAWGRIVDRLGNRTAMAIAIVIGGFIPQAWLFVSAGHYGILFVEAFFSGAMWAGAGLVGTNFVLAIAPPGRRQTYAGVYGACAGLAMMATMLLSGALLPPPLHLGRLALQGEQLLFGLTGLLRWTALIPLLLIAEPEVPSTAEALYTLQQYAKVRIAGLATRMSRRR